MAGSIFNRAKAVFGRSEPEAKPVVTPRKPARPYHAVCVIPGERACSAVEELRGKRYLSREAPILPLKACDKATCQCRYEHYKDRRKGPRRTRDYGVSIAGWEDGPEQRQNDARGRRKTDR